MLRSIQFNNEISFQVLLIIKAVSLGTNRSPYFDFKKIPPMCNNALLIIQDFSQKILILKNASVFVKQNTNSYPTM